MNRHGPGLGLEPTNLIAFYRFPLITTPCITVMNRHGPGLGLEPTDLISAEDTPVVELCLSIMLSLTIGDALSAFSLLNFPLGYSYAR